jgi:hypothetical protein
VTSGSLMVFSGTPVSFTNKTGRRDITEILLKVALNTITKTVLTCSELSNEEPGFVIHFLKHFSDIF